MTQENNLAPIVLFTYNRPDYTKQIVEALQKNEIAKYQLYLPDKAQFEKAMNKIIEEE